MELSEILNIVSNVSTRLGTSKPYICGGTPRDKVMGKVLSIEDIDLTTGDNTIKNLSKGVAGQFSGPGISYQEMSDGHSKLILPNVKLDFSTNYIQPGVVTMLVKAGLQSPTSMQQELYSRDFTCNSLLMNLSLNKVYDPIGLGIKDIKAKVLRTCLPAKITLGSDHRRVVRVIYMAAKLGFTVDPEIIRWVKANPATLVPEGKQDYVTKKLNKSLSYNKNITIKLINDMNLWSYVPPSEQLMPYLRRV